MSFFEKLKKGMGIEIPIEEETKEKLKPAKEKKSSRKVEIKSEEKPVEKSKSETEEIEIKKEKWFEPEGQLAVDVYQTETDLVIQSAIAGVKPEFLDISLEKDVLTIKGNRERPFEEKGDYFTRECYWGPFSKEIIIPVEVDPNRAEATMKEGILTIRIPKIEREKKRKIGVKG
ncbi:MAG: Hsp20/alpha crystallin family protein [Patescibacteria group bacterium]|nr:Hsp20/alpha crystallin family protein [Patescibacteria group bacterium]